MEKDELVAYLHGRVEALSAVVSLLAATSTSLDHIMVLLNEHLNGIITSDDPSKTNDSYVSGLKSVYDYLKNAQKAQAATKYDKSANSEVN